MSTKISNEKDYVNPPKISGTDTAMRDVSEPTHTTKADNKIRDWQWLTAEDYSREQYGRVIKGERRHHTPLRDLRDVQDAVFLVARLQKEGIRIGALYEKFKAHFPHGDIINGRPVYKVDAISLMFRVDKGMKPLYTITIDKDNRIIEVASDLKGPGFDRSTEFRNLLFKLAAFQIKIKED